MTGLAPLKGDSKREKHLFEQGLGVQTVCILHALCMRDKTILNSLCLLIAIALSVKL